MVECRAGASDASSARSRCPREASKRRAVAAAGTPPWWRRTTESRPTSATSAPRICSARRRRRRRRCRPACRPARRRRAAGRAPRARRCRGPRSSCPAPRRDTSRPDRPRGRCSMGPTVRSPRPPRPRDRAGHGGPPPDASAGTAPVRLASEPGAQPRRPTGDEPDLGVGQASRDHASGPQPRLLGRGQRRRQPRPRPRGRPARLRRGLGRRGVRLRRRHACWPGSRRRPSGSTSAPRSSRSRPARRR